MHKILVVLLLLVLGVLAVSGPIQAQENTDEGVDVLYLGPLGEDYSLYWAKLTDSNLEACLVVAPKTAGAEIGSFCSLSLRGVELRPPTVFVASYAEKLAFWNVKIDLPGPDGHCLIITSTVPGPEPFISCTF